MQILVKILSTKIVPGKSLSSHWRKPTMLVQTPDNLYVTSYSREFDYFKNNVGKEITVNTSSDRHFNYIYIEGK